MLRYSENAPPVSRTKLPRNDVQSLYTSVKNPSSGMTDLIVKTAVKEEVEDYNVAEDLYDALGDEVAELLGDAADRAEANDRKTVQAQDL